jgi:hypothetical protein
MFIEMSRVTIALWLLQAFLAYGVKLFLNNQ